MEAVRRAEMGMPRVAKGVHPASEGVWRVLATTVGPTFSHNTFVMAARKAGVGREQARRDFRVLSQRYNGQEPQEKATVTQTTTRETPTPAQADAGELATLRQQVQAQDKELSDLRQRVQTLAPSRAPEGEWLSRLARVEARLVSQDRTIEAVEEQLRLVKGKVNAHDTIVMTVQELLALLTTNDDAFDTLARIVRPASSHSQRTLQQFLWAKVGRKLDRNDFIPAL